MRLQKFFPLVKMAEIMMVYLCTLTLLHSKSAIGLGLRHIINVLWRNKASLMRFQCVWFCAE